MFFEDQKNNSGRIYFFGGNSTGKPVKSTKKAQVEGVPLYELVIGWNEKNEPIQAEIKLVQRQDGSTIIFPGQPLFKQTLPNKKYVPQTDRWYFVDDSGNFYVYDMKKQKVLEHRIIQTEN